MKTALTLMTCVVALAACNNSPNINEKNASVEEVAAKVREASGDPNFVRPGKWQSNVTIEAMEIPGMPPEAAKQMKSAMANQRHDYTSCLTPEDVKQRKGKIFSVNDQCRYDRFTMAGGKIDATMSCPGGGPGGPRVMTVKGTYGPEQYDMHMTTKAEGSGEGGLAGRGGMNMEMRVESKRIGECSAADIEAESAPVKSGN